MLSEQQRTGQNCKISMRGPCVPRAWPMCDHRFFSKSGCDWGKKSIRKKGLQLCILLYALTIVLRARRVVVIPFVRNGAKTEHELNLNNDASVEQI